VNIATLGPAGTFSDLAAQRYVKSLGQPAEVRYFTHLKRCLQAVEDDCQQVVVPIENISEGFVPVVLDHLVAADLHIVAELHLAIQFALIVAAPAQQSSIPPIDKLYVQFVARGQCNDMIAQLGDIELVATESNTESLQRFLHSQSQQACAAIVPAHLMQRSELRRFYQRQQVQDLAHNQTRFLVLQPGPPPLHTSGCKTSLMVVNDNDHPGLLEQVLHCFSARRLNLTSIVSRPTGQGFGRYHFFMDVAERLDSLAMQGALNAVARLTQVKVLGCYRPLADE
jgi:prephenate dehydratase